MPSTTAARSKTGGLPLSSEKSSLVSDPSAAYGTVKRVPATAYTVTDAIYDGPDSSATPSSLVLSSSGKLSDDPFNEADEDDYDEPDVIPTSAWPNVPCLSCISGAFLSACWEIICLAIPLALGFIAQAAANVVNLAFVGHLGEDELAASSLAILFCNVTGVSPVVGLLSTMDTLGSQAYGARNFKRVGIILQRGLAISSVQVLPFIAIWCFSEPILQLVGISATISAMASRYIIIMIAALPAQAYTSALQRYLEVQSCTRPIMVSTLVSVGGLVGFNILFINVLEIGYLGAAYATIISQYMTFCTIFGYIYFSGFYKLTWGGWSREALRGWGEYIRIGLPGAGMICAEWWGFEMHTLVSARLGTSALAAQSIVIQLIGLLFTVPQATGIAAAALVGRALGANRPVAARQYAAGALVLSALGQFVIGGVMAVTREQIGRIFTEEEKVLEITSTALMIVSGFILFDGLQGTASGVLRGAGRQIIGFYVNILCYWVYAMPVAIALAFYVGHWDRPADDDHPASRETGLGVPGQWIALASASITATLLMVVFILRLRWADIASEVHVRELKHRAEAKAAEEAEAEAEAEAAAAIAGADASVVIAQDEAEIGGYLPSSSIDALGHHTRTGQRGQGQGQSAEEQEQRRLYEDNLIHSQFAQGHAAHGQYHYGFANEHEHAHAQPSAAAVAAAPADEEESVGYYPSDSAVAAAAEEESKGGEGSASSAALLGLDAFDAAGSGISAGIAPAAAAAAAGAGAGAGARGRGKKGKGKKIRASDD